MSDNRKPYTYSDLLNALAKLDGAQLSMPVRWSGDERGGEVMRLWVAEEDYTHVSGEFAEPMSVYPPEHEDHEAAKGAICWPKGMPILDVD